MRVVLLVDVLVEHRACMHCPVDESSPQSVDDVVGARRNDNQDHAQRVVQNAFVVLDDRRPQWCVIEVAIER